MLQRALNTADTEILNKIKELQLFVNEKMINNEVSNISKSQILINDIQMLHLIWRSQSR